MTYTIHALLCLIAINNTQLTVIKSVTLDPSTLFSDGATISIANTSEVTSSGSTWDIEASGADTWHILVTLDNSFGFHATKLSKISIQFNSDTIPGGSTFNDIIIAFTVANKFSAIKMKMDNSWPNVITPGTCDFTDPYSSSLRSGDLSTILKGGSSTARDCDMGLMFNCGNPDYVTMKSSSGSQGQTNSFPIKFTIENNPSNYMLLTSEGDVDLQCGFDHGFDTNQGMQIYFAVDQSGHSCSIKSIKIEYAIDGTLDPTLEPTYEPTDIPTVNPTLFPTESPTISTINPTMLPTVNPTTTAPTSYPTTSAPTSETSNPTSDPTLEPTYQPTINPITDPTVEPTVNPTYIPTINPTMFPSSNPTMFPTVNPTTIPTLHPTMLPSVQPTTRMATTADPTTTEPTTATPTTAIPTTVMPSNPKQTKAPITALPTTDSPTTAIPTLSPLTHEDGSVKEETTSATFDRNDFDDSQENEPLIEGFTNNYIIFGIIGVSICILMVVICMIYIRIKRKKANTKQIQFGLATNISYDKTANVTCTPTQTMGTPSDRSNINLQMTELYRNNMNFPTLPVNNANLQIIGSRSYASASNSNINIYPAPNINAVNNNFRVTLSNLAGANGLLMDDVVNGIKIKNVTAGGPDDTDIIDSHNVTAGGYDDTHSNDDHLNMIEGDDLTDTDVNDDFEDDENIIEVVETKGNEAVMENAHLSEPSNKYEGPNSMSQNAIDFVNNAQQDEVIIGDDEDDMEMDVTAGQ